MFGYVQKKFPVLGENKYGQESQIGENNCGKVGLQKPRSFFITWQHHFKLQEKNDTAGKDELIESSKAECET